MTSNRRVGLLTACVLFVVGLLSLAATPAVADVNGAESALRSANLYVDGAADAKLDQGSASAALSDRVKVAVLPSDAGNAGQLARQIGQSLGSTVTVGVFVGHTFNAASNLLCTGQAGSLAARAVSDNRSQLQSDNDLTNTIKDFATLVNAAAPCAQGSRGDNSGGSAAQGSDHGSSHNGWIALGVLGLLGAACVGGVVAWRRRRDRMAISDARASVQPFYDRLAADVYSLQPGDNAVARQALADASERLTSGGSQLSNATRLAQVAGARRSLLEGLQAAQTARRALGLDPGPELPPIVESQAPQLSEAQEFSAGGRTVQGYPAYTPGAPYYFAGGGGYAGGWYSFPFWESLLIAEALSPGWGWGGGGWGWGGGGFDGGYASGYDSGFDAGQDAVQQNGGDWGGGGDWGSGGDWGGGGGDWGGGGGDWGGGGSDGGGSW